MKISIMRHGETQWNKERKLQGQSDICLNDYGKELAYATKEGMKDEVIDCIFTSPLTRTRETAAIMAEDRTISITPDQRLIEIAFGVGEGANIDEVNQDETCNLYYFLHRPEEYTPLEGGESFDQVKERCISFINEVLLPLEGKKDHVLLVAHGAFIRVMISYVQGYSYKEFWERNKHKNCAVTSFSLEDGKLTLLEEGKLYYEDRKNVDW